MVASSFRDLRVWNSAREFKLAVYKLLEAEPMSRDRHLCEQLRKAAASPPSQIAEGYGRFDPGDNARFIRIGKASVMECQNHLQDALDRGLISDATYQLHDTQAQNLLKELDAYLTYLQSEAARRNADRIRRARRSRPHPDRRE